MLARALILKTSALRPVERMVRHSFLFRGMVRRFIAGETLEEAIAVCEGLAERGYFYTLDYLGENTKSEEEALAARQTFVRMLQAIEASRLPASGNISIKLTQCGLALGDELAERNLRAVLTFAQSSDNFVRVDMESSEYTERTVDMILKLSHDFANTGTVLQSYLKRTPEDVKTMIRLGIRTRLVKGAYLEPESVAFQGKRKVDEVYYECGKLLLEHGNYPAIATHDEKLIGLLEAYASEKGIEKSRFEFQMLFGIRRDLQERLRAGGYNVRIYVPYGESWYPYFTRRLAERPANVWFILRAMFKRGG